MSHMRLSQCHFKETKSKNTTNYEMLIFNRAFKSVIFMNVSSRLNFCHTLRKCILTLTSFFTVRYNYYVNVVTHLYELRAPRPSPFTLHSQVH